MPELPEVETVRRALDEVLGQTVVLVTVISPSMVRGIDPEAFVRSLEGERIEEIRRRGKYLLFSLSSGATLIGHLMMAGRLLLKDPGQALPPHTHVILSLSGGRELVYQDLRHFGGFRLVEPGGTLPMGLVRMGPEPFDPALTAPVLARMLRERHGKIKGALLDQHFIAGLGNIYVDEALFEARIHPETGTDSIGSARAAELLSAIQSVLERAISHRGTTFGTYMDLNGRPGENAPALKVFRREGKPCPRCGTPIVKFRVAGRGTHICPRCQVKSRRRGFSRRPSSSPTDPKPKPERTSRVSGGGIRSRVKSS